MNLTGLAALLGVPLSIVPVAISALNGRSLWRQLERAAKVAKSFEPGAAEAVALRELELVLIRQLHRRATIPAEVSVMRLGAAVAITAAALGFAGSVIGVVKTVFPSRILDGLTVVLLLVALAMFVAGVLSAALSPFLLRLVAWVRRRFTAPETELSSEPAP